MRRRRVPTIEDIQQRGDRDNPDLRAAWKRYGKRITRSSVRRGYLPASASTIFTVSTRKTSAVNTRVKTSAGTQKFSNLGSSAWINTENIPIWNWGATQSKVRQAELGGIRQSGASLAQRKLVAEIPIFVRRSKHCIERTGGLTALRRVGGGKPGVDNSPYKNGRPRCSKSWTRKPLLLRRIRLSGRRIALSRGAGSFKF